MTTTPPKTPPLPSQSSFRGVAPPKKESVIYGERFEPKQLLSKDLFGEVHIAMDVKNKRRVGLRLINNDLVASEAVMDQLRNEMMTASTFVHRNVLTTYGMGRGPDGRVFVSLEFIEGERLEALLLRRKKSGKHFSNRGLYNIAANILNGLEYIHTKSFHGALSPRVILVNRSGRIKVGEIGLSSLLLAAPPAHFAKFPESRFLAPEVRNRPGRMDARSDIYGVGALLYYILTNTLPVGNVPAREKIKPEIPAKIYDIIVKAMDPDPARRFATAVEMRNLLREVAHSRDSALPPPPEGETVDDDIAIDIVIEAAMAPSPQASAPGVRAVPAAPMHSGAHQALPAFQASVSGAMPAIQSLSGFDMSKILSTVSSDNVERWMVQKDKLDHGPFTDRELIQQILRGEVVAKHNLLNMDNGVRKKVKDWPEFVEFLARYQQRKKLEEEKAAKQRAEKVESRTNWTQYTIAGAIVIVIGIGIGLYFYSRQRSESKARSGNEIAAMFEKGEIQLKMSAGILEGPDSDRARRGGHHGGKAGGGTHGGGSSYEEAMNQAVDLGNLLQQGGQTQLTAPMITQIMQQNQRKFFPCIIAELSKNPTLKEVKMNFVISGSGEVAGTTVMSASTSLQQCMASKMQSLKFPAFSSPRMGATFSFYVGN